MGGFRRLASNIEEVCGLLVWIIWLYRFKWFVVQYNEIHSGTLLCRITGSHGKCAWGWWYMMVCLVKNDTWVTVILLIHRAPPRKRICQQNHTSLYQEVEAKLKGHPHTVQLPQFILSNHPIIITLILLQFPLDSERIHVMYHVICIWHNLPLNPCRILPPPVRVWLNQSAPPSSASPPHLRRSTLQPKDKKEEKVADSDGVSKNHALGRQEWHK